MLRHIEWGEFKLEDLFGNATRGKRLKSEDRIEGDLPFVTAGEANEGVSAFIGNDVEIFSENTITIDMFGSAKYRNYRYGGDDHIAVVHTEALSKGAAIFITSAIHKSTYTGDFNYGRNFYAKDADKTIIQLPIQNGKLALDFMESFISKREAEKTSELNAYLEMTGLNNYTLTEQEEKVLSGYNQIIWSEFKMDDLFGKAKTKKLPFKADDLPQEPKDEYVLPCLTASFNNQGLNYFAPKDNATILKNVISLPSNSDVYRAYYQSNDFTVLSDAYAVHWKYTDADLLSTQYLFAVSCINKVTDLPIYSHKNKLGGWNVVKNKYIQLPVNDGEIDYDTMQTLISAIQKLVIKDVVLYVGENRNDTHLQQKEEVYAK